VGVVLLISVRGWDDRSGSGYDIMKLPKLSMPRLPGLPRSSIPHLPILRIGSGSSKAGATTKRDTRAKTNKGK
jgi:hypothetical protein